MISTLFKLLNKIPQPYRLIVFFAVVVTFGGLIFLAFDQVSSCRYNNGRAQYEKEKREWTKQREAWATERAGLIATAEGKEKRIAELEPKAIAFDTLAEQNKRIDAGLAKQVEEVSKNAAIQEANAELPTECRVRVERVCALLRANKYNADCARITAESCGAR